MGVGDVVTDLDWELLEQRYRAPIGPTFRALLRLATDRNRGDPASGLEPDFGMRLPVLDPAHTHMRGGRLPIQVRAIAIGTEGTECGFLEADPTVAQEEQPIIFVSPKSFEETDWLPHVIAPNLRAFLGLVACRGMHEMSRSWTDEQWPGATFPVDHPVVAALLAIPGVLLASKPAAVTHAAPDWSPPTPLLPADRPPFDLSLLSSKDLKRAYRAWEHGDIGAAIKDAYAALHDSVTARAAGLLLIELLHATQTYVRAADYADWIAMRWLGRPRTTTVDDWTRLLVLYERLEADERWVTYRKVKDHLAVTHSTP